MITDSVIKEIYKKYSKAAKNPDDLRLDYFIDLLAPNHNIRVDGAEIILEDQEEFNPFRRFLIRGLHAVLEFDRQVAFVFRNHILFLGKDSDGCASTCLRSAIAAIFFSVCSPTEKVLIIVRNYVSDFFLRQCCLKGTFQCFRLEEISKRQFKFP